MQLRPLHDKLSALLEDPARDLYAETIFTLAADYLAANAANLQETPACHAPTGEDEDTACTQCGQPTDDGEGYDGLCGICADKHEPTPWYRNHYKCECGTEWQDEHDCMCDDRCPTCNLSMQPHHSDDLTGEPDTDGATYVRCVACGEFVIEGEWSAHCENHA